MSSCITAKMEKTAMSTFLDRSKTKQLKMGSFCTPVVKKENHYVNITITLSVVY